MSFSCHKTPKKEKKQDLKANTVPSTFSLKIREISGYVSLEFNIIFQQRFLPRFVIRNRRGAVAVTILFEKLILYII
jgi:hypothetical protein